ncbi:MAG: tetratricopeptide repeat protein [Planctomycetales bacterium]|nr:tetratricopeptide repeat protein [Planctomycetales bacterium]
MTGTPSASTVSSIVAMAVGLHRQAHLEEAEELYRRALGIAPDHVDALHFFGVLQHQRGDDQAAQDLIRAALRRAPDYVDARINLGNVLKGMARFEEAERSYRMALESRPDSADAHNNLACVLRGQGRVEEAIASFEQALGLAPEHTDALTNLGNALKFAGRFEESLTAYRRAVEVDPRHCEAHLSLGRALYSLGRLEEAEIVYGKWLEVEPDNPIAAHMYAACKGEQTLERCSDAFVQQSFDAFADSFDAVLTRLQYRVPELVSQAIEAAMPPPAGQWNVLDAGCGTGLCGPRLRPYARRLVGIDLSPGMIHKARALDLYEELQVRELTEFMQQQPGQFDLIIAADTLCYFGALLPVLQAAAAALSPEGTLVFTLERAEEESAAEGWRLNPHGRFSHTRPFVSAALGQAGLSVCDMRLETLRMEVHQPVEGLLVTARKRA